MDGGSPWRKKDSLSVWHKMVSSRPKIYIKFIINSVMHQQGCQTNCYACSSTFRPVRRHHIVLQTLYPTLVIFQILRNLFDNPASILNTLPLAHSVRLQSEDGGMPTWHFCEELFVPLLTLLTLWWNLKFMNMEVSQERGSTVQSI